MFRTYRYRIYPTKTQEHLMHQTIDVCRNWYNACLEERKALWESEHKNTSRNAQLRKIKDLRKQNPRAEQIHCHALQVATSDLDKAFSGFFSRIKSGVKAGLPRFKGERQFNSFGLPEHGRDFRIDGRRLKISKIGRVAVRWYRPIDGDIRTLRIIRKNGKWFALITCLVDGVRLPETGNSIGIDVGIASLITTSAGDKVDNPKWYRLSQGRQRVLQRSLFRREKGSNRRRKALIKYGRHQSHIANQRLDFIHKLSRRIINQNDLVAIEDLDITMLSRNRYLAKSILDSGWDYFRRQLVYKAEYAGRTVVAVDPAYTSKTCSNCGAEFENFNLSVRWVDCKCGLSLDRDHNAAINILNRAGRVLRGETWPNGASVPREPELRK